MMQNEALSFQSDCVCELKTVDMDYEEIPSKKGILEVSTLITSESKRKKYQKIHEIQ